MKCTLCRLLLVGCLLPPAPGLVIAGTLRPSLSERVAMADQTHLATDVYLPTTGDGPWPALLVRTPYNKDRYNNEFGPFAQRGYAMVIQDMRGRFGSEGRDLAFLDCGGNENNDGRDTIRWIARQPWCNGKVGTVGASAMGITQNLLARTAPNNLAAQYIMVASGSIYHQGAYNDGGALRMEVSLSYTLDNALNPANTWLSVLHPMYDAHWRRLDATLGIEEVNVPAVHYGGWYDCFLPGTLATFTARQERGGPGARGAQKLLVGAWGHGGPGTDARPKRIGEFLFPSNIRKLPVPIGANEWFGRYLKGSDTGADRAPAVVYYTMGAIDEPDAPGNTWRAESTWPPQSLHRDLYLCADGSLKWQRPSDAGQTRKLTCNPLDPVPTRGGCNLAIPAGAFDQREIEKRPDVLVFTSEPLTEPLEVTGPVAARLLVASDCPDTDFAAKLCDVYPDGRSMNICDGLLRLRHRNGVDRLDPLKPGEMVPVRVSMDATSIVFNRGHRIRLAVSGSNYPRFDINPNTGWPAWPFCPVRVANNTVFCSGDQASCIELPVVTRPLPESADSSPRTTASQPAALRAEMSLAQTDVDNRASRAGSFVYADWRKGKPVHYVITTEEERQSDGPLPQAHLLSLKQVLHLTLTPQHVNSDGSGSMGAKLDRIELTGNCGGRMIRYDSDQDKPDQGNPVADLLSSIVHQEFRIRLAPGGRFAEVAGLNGIWRGKGLLAAPASVVSVQFLFRDQAMLSLLSEALSPPLDRNVNTPGTSWQARIPGEIIGLTMLECDARFEAPSQTSTAASTVHILGAGGLQIARPLGDIAGAGLMSHVKSSQRRCDLTIDSLSRQVISHEISREAVLSVKLAPPAGGASPSMSMRQKLRTVVTRQGK